MKITEQQIIDAGKLGLKYGVEVKVLSLSRN